MEKTKPILDWIKNNPKQSLLFGCFTAGAVFSVIRKYIAKMTPYNCILELDLSDVEFSSVCIRI